MPEPGSDDLRRDYPCETPGCDLNRIPAHPFCWRCEEGLPVRAPSTQLPLTATLEEADHPDVKGDECEPVLLTVHEITHADDVTTTARG